MLPRTRGFFVDIPMADIFIESTLLVQTSVFAICYDCGTPNQNLSVYHTLGTLHS
jgi:hypothetical protein